MKYTVTVPPTAEQGSYKTTVSGSHGQTYRAEALQDYNSCRAHDGLPPVSRMPAGTTYTPIEYQPKTGQPCGCKPGQMRNNCPACEGTGMKIDFAAIRNRHLAA